MHNSRQYQNAGGDGKPCKPVSPCMQAGGGPRSRLTTELGNGWSLARLIGEMEFNFPSDPDLERSFLREGVRKIVLFLVNQLNLEGTERSKYLIRL